MRLYHYIGPKELLRSLDNTSPRHELTGPSGLEQFAKSIGVSFWNGSATFSYVVLPPMRLFIADRRSEHLACARGEPVLTAGEITFTKGSSGLEVSAANNLSTGYCPESSSWGALDLALRAANLSGIHGFAPSFEFRFCAECSMTCVIKNEVYECPRCLGVLPREWNCHITF